MAHQPGPGPARRVVMEGRPLVPEVPPGAQPSPQAVEVLQNLVRSQADAVRALKTQQGLPNQVRGMRDGGDSQCVPGYWG